MTVRAFIAAVLRLVTGRGKARADVRRAAVSREWSVAVPAVSTHAARATASQAVVPRSTRLPSQRAAGPPSVLTHRNTQACGSASDGPALVRAESSHATYPLACDGGQSHIDARHRLAAAQLAHEREAT